MACKSNKSDQLYRTTAPYRLGPNDYEPSVEKRADEEWADFVKRTEWTKKGEFQYHKNEICNRLKLENSEREFQAKLSKEKQDDFERKMKMKYEEKCANELKEQMNVEIIENAFRTKLYECAPELRELEKQLKQAHYAKTLYAQRADAEAKRLEEKMRQLEAHQMLMEQLAKAEAEDERKAMEEEMRKRQYSLALKSQIVDTSSKRVREQTESLKDKEMIDEIVNTIKQEEIEDLTERQKKLTLYQKEIDNFMKLREDHKRREAELLKNEEIKIQEFVQDKESQYEAFNKFKEERDRAKASIVSKAVQEMLKNQYNREELEELRRELFEEEMSQKAREWEEEERKRRIEMMVELQNAQAEANQIRFEKIQQEKMEEEKLRQQLIQKFEDDEREEQMSREKRKQKEREYRLKVEEIMIERRAQKAQLREKDFEQRHCFDEENARRQALIDQERIKILKEFGPKLLGFIPKGVIKSKEELMQLGEPFISYFKNPPREYDETTKGYEPCEDQLFKNFVLPKYAKQ